jgi:hypothetical protein
MGYVCHSEPTVPFERLYLPQGWPFNRSDYQLEQSLEDPSSQAHAVYFPHDGCCQIQGCKCDSNGVKAAGSATNQDH